MGRLLWQVRTPAPLRMLVLARSRLRVLVAVAVLIGGAAPCRGAAVGIVLNPPGYGTTKISASAAGGGVFGREEAAFPVSVPDAGELHTMLPESGADHTYDLSETGFAFTFALSNDGTTDAGASSTASILFIASTDVEYAITGRYEAIDPDGKQVFFSIGLIPLTGGSGGFFFLEDTMGVPNVSFSVGAQPGATGTLEAGHIYHFLYQAGAGNPSETNLRPFTANGFATLSFVPEPRMAALVGTAVLLIVRTERKRRSST